MVEKNNSVLKKIFAIVGLVVTLFFCFLGLASNASMAEQIGYFAVFELLICENLFFVHNAFSKKHSFDIFFVESKSGMIPLFWAICANEVAVAICYAVLKNLWYLLWLIAPILTMLALLAIWRYFNFDSKCLHARETNLYLGVAVNNHFVYDGVDILSSKFCQNAGKRKLTLLNPLNGAYSYSADNVFYVSGKDYKFYVATHKISDLYTLAYLVRNKDAFRIKKNKHIDEDYELNKNIYVAYCLDDEKPEQDYTYSGENLRYKITSKKQDGTQKSFVDIEQKTELPNLTPQNKISNWIGDSFPFETKKQAEEFVRFAIEQIKSEEGKENV